MFMAVANSATQCAEVLREYGAVLETDESTHKAEGKPANVLVKELETHQMRTANLIIDWLTLV